MAKVKIVALVDSEELPPQVIQQKLTNMLENNVVVKMGLKGTKVKVLALTAESVG